MAKRIVAMLIMSLLVCKQMRPITIGNAGSFSRAVSKKLKSWRMACDKDGGADTTHGERAETLARLAECDAETRKRRRREGSMRPIPQSLICLHSMAVERFSASFFVARLIGLFMELVY